ncbi:MAG: hypothetical protein ABL925_09345 [Methylococcales bacterium]
MLTSEPTLLGQEWRTLQNNYEHYESNAFLIKLSAVALYLAAQVLLLNSLVTAAIILILWVQEGIFRTYQARLGRRILRIEGLLKQAEPAIGAACQLHTHWLAERKGFSGLLAEYAASTARPTVAFPYAVLLLLHVLAKVF